MTVRKFAVSDAAFERSPGQDGEVFAANLIDQRHGGPITIGYGRYGANQSLEETIAVHDVMVVLEGRLSVSSNAGTVTAGPARSSICPRASRSLSALTSREQSRPMSPIRTGRRRTPKPPRRAPVRPRRTRTFVWP